MASKPDDRLAMLTPVPLICRCDALPMPVPELKFHPTRKWRFDWSWPAYKVALEIDGGVWNQGRHSRAKGFMADQEKRNQATLLGWKVFYCTPQTLVEGMACVKQALLSK